MATQLQTEVGWSINPNSGYMDRNHEPQRPANHYQVDLTGTPDQVRLPGLLDSEWPA
jgi:hypothetical protein